MIRRLEISNFKSLRHVVIDLSHINVFLGPNASGKSNIFSALHSFRDLARSRDINDAVDDHGGARELRTRGAKKTPTIRFSLTVDLKRTAPIARHAPWATSLTYAIEFTCYTDRKQRIVSEELTLGSESKQEECIFRRELNRVRISERLQHLFGLPLLQSELPGFFSSVPLLEFVRMFGEWEVLDLLRRIRFYNINVREARKSSDATSARELSEDGSNLAAVLFELSKQKRRAGGDRGLSAGFRDFLKASIPEFEDFRGKKRGRGKGGLTTFDIRESKGWWFSPQSVSDGTVKAMCFFLAALYGKDPGAVVCFEEPENSVHPYLLSSMMQVLRDNPGTPQILMTTHSDVVANAFRPESVFLVTKEAGDTQVKRADTDEQIKQFCQRYGIGEAWRRGLIGAIP